MAIYAEMRKKLRLAILFWMPTYPGHFKVHQQMLNAIQSNMVPFSLFAQDYSYTVPTHSLSRFIPKLSRNYSDETLGAVS